MPFNELEPPEGPLDGTPVPEDVDAVSVGAVKVPFVEDEKVADALDVMLLLVVVPHVSLFINCPLTTPLSLIG